MGRGIFAGLHWFPNYWGRDTFISLPGACLVRGEFGAAREIIETFTGLLETRKDSPFYGRVPNLAMPGRVYYNTADGTWWLVREILEYLMYTGDRDFAARLFPVVETAIEAALERRVDASLFFTHGEAETWMDAGGEERPYSPRGNRAVEIEALWYTALRSGAAIARAADRPEAAVRWDETAEKVRAAFGQAFWDEERAGLYDHLNPDGTPDRKIRPNQIFAVTVPWDELLPADRSEKVVRLVGETCVLPHGVASLDPRDPYFHPRHLDLERYPFDEAYHNGDVWIWLTGPVVSAFVRHGLVGRAWEQTTVLTNLIFDEGAAGTLAELRNGVPPEKGENVTGAVSQAWSLAEFLRNFYQDYLGVTPNLLDGTIDLHPVLPPDLSWVAAPIHLGPGALFLFCEVAEDRTKARYRLTADAALPPLRIRFEGRAPLGADVQEDVVRTEASLEPGGTLEFTVEKGPAGFSARVSAVSAPHVPRSDRS
jgi:glycogen debranching enzyme